MQPSGHQMAIAVVVKSLPVQQLPVITNVAVAMSILYTMVSTLFFCSFQFLQQPTRSFNLVANIILIRWFHWWMVNVRFSVYLIFICYLLQSSTCLLSSPMYLFVFVDNGSLMMQVCVSVSLAVTVCMIMLVCKLYAFPRSGQIQPAYFCQPTVSLGTTLIWSCQSFSVELKMYMTFLPRRLCSF